MYGLVVITLTARQLAGHCLVYALQLGHELATFCKLVFTASVLSIRLERHHACRDNNTFKLYFVLLVV